MFLMLGLPRRNCSHFLQSKASMALNQEVRVDSTCGGSSIMKVLAIRQDGYIVAGSSAWCPELNFAEQLKQRQASQCGGSSSGVPRLRPDFLEWNPPEGSEAFQMPVQMGRSTSSLRRQHAATESNGFHGHKQTWDEQDRGFQQCISGRNVMWELVGGRLRGSLYEKPSGRGSWVSEIFPAGILCTTWSFSSFVDSNFTETWWHLYKLNTL